MLGFRCTTDDTLLYRSLCMCSERDFSGAEPQAQNPYFFRGPVRAQYYAEPQAQNPYFFRGPLRPQYYAERSQK